MIKIVRIKLKIFFINDTRKIKPKIYIIKKTGSCIKTQFYIIR
jgi:hypothetical protein